jgi:hypothetical protein
MDGRNCLVTRASASPLVDQDGNGRIGLLQTRDSWEHVQFPFRQKVASDGRLCIVCQEERLSLHPSLQYTQAALRQSEEEIRKMLGTYKVTGRAGRQTQGRHDST